jgi:4-amino-4-deoxy-L-arabinose transferase-like glycosyltransferase
MNEKAMRNQTRWLIIVVIAFGFYIYLRGLQQELPYFVHEDERVFVIPVVNMVAQGTLNPAQFGNPGSTVIYPHYGFYQIIRLVSPEQMAVYQDAPFARLLSMADGFYYLVGRLVTIYYATLSLPLIYVLGKRAFNSVTGVGGALLFLFYPLVVLHSQMVRTDSATVFWGTLSLWLCLRLLDRPSLGRQVLAGSAIGLAIATKYYMAGLVPVLLAVEGMIFLRMPSLPVRQRLVPMIVGLAVIPLTFTVSTPYFFLDFSTTVANLQHELRSSHPAFESFSPTGNFIWYLTQAIPDAMGWIQYALVLVGLGLVLLRHRAKQLLLVGYVLIHLLGISLSGLRWTRWTIQVLPVLALLTAFAVERGLSFVTRRRRYSARPVFGVFVAALLLLSWPHASQLIATQRWRSNPTTQVMAGAWIRENVADGSMIVLEETGPPLGEHNYEVMKRWTVTDFDLGPSQAAELGVDYVVVSSYIYEMYLRSPERHPKAVRIYQDIFDTGQLVKEFKPGNGLRGPVIKIYRLTPPS